MDTANQSQLVFEGGVSSVNFFNGRMLTGEDLRTEQDANRVMHQRIGSAIGAGVAYGLEVRVAQGTDTPAAPMVRIDPGVAVNPKGHTLHMSTAVDFPLTVSESDAQPAEQWRGFEACRPPQIGAYVAGAGVYLLTIGPAQKKQGRAPVSGLGNVAAKCNTKYTVDGIQLRLVQIELSSAELDDKPHLRNLVAYKCYGYDNAAYRHRLTAPLSDPPQPYGLMDRLRAKGRLTDCEVPLAVLYWTASNEIQFVDTWSVRRRIVRPASDEPWSTYIEESRREDVAAMINQFQKHIVQILADRENARSVQSSQHFKYLPPAGILPLEGNGHKGFQVDRFFSASSHRRPEYISDAALGHIMRQALNFEPIALSQGELVWLYYTWQSQYNITEKNTGRPFVIFTTAHMPYMGLPRFDVSRWDFARYDGRYP